MATTEAWNTTEAADVCDAMDVDKCVSVYKCSDRGMVMPFVNEYTWPIGVRIVIYFVGLLWCFLGVAIIADTFMCSIEKITSKTRRIRIADGEAEDGYSVLEVKVWNNTVANLTLMALGTSAPEILLAIIEIVGAGFVAGELGPSTIVGSAAFNLLCITAICVMAIPSPETRRIETIKVFVVTAFFSIFAYLWMLIVLLGITPNVIDLGEAIATLALFPILVVLSYLADKNFCRKKVNDDQQMQLNLGGGALLADNHYNKASYNFREEDSQSSDHIGSTEMRKIMKELRAIHPHLADADIVKLATLKVQENQSHNHLWYRINASRQIGGSSKLTPSFNEALAEIYEHLKQQHGDKELAEIAPHHIVDDLSKNNTLAVVEFTAARISVMENKGHVTLNLVRFGKTNNRVTVRVETIDGTAEADQDYKPVKQTIVFEKEEVHKAIDIEIIDDNEWEPDEVFFIKMNLDAENEPVATILGHISIAEVTIVNDDDPGMFEFAKPSCIVKESAGRALIPIERSNGCDGKVTIKWKTDDMTAKSGADFEGGEGTIVFEHGESTKTLEIPIFDDQEFEKDETFKVTLLETNVKGAKLGRITKTIVTIVNDDEFGGMVSRLVNMTNMNLDSMRVDNRTYVQQFRDAMNVNGGDLEGATHMDYLMHFLTFGWKIIFAIVPPVNYCGGWLSFIIALTMIGLLTLIVGDLAAIFGCLTGLRDPVTAITFVAIGTSLPDLFASKQAAMMEKTADMSIGNVTGSNSVNVFLGLGLPWTLAAIYWLVQGKSFSVPSGSLSFSVIIYVVCAVICIATLMARRYLGFFGKAELGGPNGPKLFTGVFFIVLWIVYVLLSALVEYGHIKAF